MNVVLLASRYAEAQNSGLLLKLPRYRLFPLYWLVMIFILSYVVAWLYASVRATCGAGPWTALKVGVLTGFAAGFPVNLAVASWSPLNRVLPFWWMMDLWVGAILATLLAGWLYKD